jgi:hypothetical protein
MAEDETWKISLLPASCFSCPAKNNYGASALFFVFSTGSIYSLGLREK